MIFVDTSAWFARYSPRDAFYTPAREFHRANNEPLVTTDYIIDETLTLFKMRGNYERGVRFGESILSGSLAEIVWIEPDDVGAAWNVFQRYRDKQWSFTDCVSFVVLQRYGIGKAFAFDTHFQQFGTVEVVP